MKLKITLILLLTLVFLPCYGQEITHPSLKEYLDNLYQKNIDRYRELRKNDFNDFCGKYDIDGENQENQTNYFRLHFLHELFTCERASDYSYGGILQIPYFWHWVNPNSRHKIMSLPDKTYLSKIKAPQRFSKYKSFADVDRVPSLFLSDLVSDNPNYFHEKCGNFYTFGWCSEREMTFSLLLGLYGFESKIMQQGIHVWSSIWVTFIDKESRELSLIANIDNTFDTVTWNSANDLTKKKWLKEYGSGMMVKWYNKKAKEKDEINLVNQIKVGERAGKRIEKQVRKHFRELNNE